MDYINEQAKTGIYVQIVRDSEKEYKTDLRKRIFAFATETLKLLMKLPSRRELDVIKYQLSKSATAVGANYEEAQSSSDKEFIHKLRIALREANESKYWFKIMNELGLGEKEKVSELLNEAKEISLMLGSIVSKLFKKQMD